MVIILSIVTFIINYVIIGVIKGQGTAIGKGKTIAPLSVEPSF